MLRPYTPPDAESHLPVTSTKPLIEQSLNKKRPSIRKINVQTGVIPNPLGIKSNKFSPYPNPKLKNNPI